MDIQFLLWLQQVREATGYAADGFFALITHLGSLYPAIVIMALLYWSVDKKSGRFLLLTDLWATLTGQTLKIIFCEYRPWVRSSLIEPVAAAVSGATGYSFPSGHTTNAVSLFGGLAICAAGRGPGAGSDSGEARRAERAGAATDGHQRAANGKVRRSHTGTVVFFIFLAALIGFSRLYCEVHTPQDVAVGAVIGIFWLWASGRILRAAGGYGNGQCSGSGQRSSNGRRGDSGQGNGSGRVVVLAALITCAASVGLIIYAALKRYPMDTNAAGELLMDPAVMTQDTCRTAAGVAGAMLGWILEARCVRFTTDGLSLRTRILRFVTGGIGAGLILVIGSKVLYPLCGETAGRMLKYGLLCFDLVGLHPLLFTLAERRSAAK